MLNTSSVGGVSKSYYSVLDQKIQFSKIRKYKPWPTVYDTEHKVGGRFVLLAYTKSATNRERFKYKPYATSCDSVLYSLMILCFTF